MRLETTIRELYKFKELEEDTQEKAIEKLWDINVDFDQWWDCIDYDAKEIGKLMGIDISDIYFSGFSSQGDGACFEGRYEYNNGSYKAVKEYAPLDKELHRIAKGLQEAQRVNFYQVYATVKHRGHYYHSLCTDIDVYREDGCVSNENEFIELLRDYMEWIYRQLEKNYEYLTSREAIIETIEANDYEFTKEGRLS